MNKLHEALATRLLAKLQIRTTYDHLRELETTEAKSLLTMTEDERLSLEKEGGNRAEFYLKEMEQANKDFGPFTEVERKNWTRALCSTYGLSQ